MNHKAQRLKHALEICDIHHAFARLRVLKGISFKVDPGNIVCLLGPSGSGKTTLLRIIAGLLTPQNGSICINGVNQRNIPTYKRDIGFVFQSPTALFPHLNVYDNISFSFKKGKKQLENYKWEKAVAEIMQITELYAFQNSSIANLSGGQQQRVALARALVYRPSLFLLDEPLSSLDNVLKNTMIDLLLKLQNEFNTTFIYVTHDEREALRIGTHIAILNEGKLCQFGSTDEIVRTPSTPEVATIIGGWNIIDSEISSESQNLLSMLESNISLQSKKHVNNSNIIGVPITATNLVQTIPDIISDGNCYIPVKIANYSPWYRGVRYDCLFNNNLQLIAYIDQTTSVVIEKSGFITFRKEDVHVFNS